MPGAKARSFMESKVHASGLGFGYIDTHNHLHGGFPSPSGFSSDYMGAAKVALAAMKKLGIRKMFVMPPPFPTDHPGRYDIDVLDNIAKKYPDRFAFLGGGGH